MLRFKWHRKFEQFGCCDDAPSIAQFQTRWSFSKIKNVEKPTFVDSAGKDFEPDRKSVVAESDDGVNSDGAAGREHAAEDSGDGKDERNGDEGCGVAGRDADEKRAEDAGDCKRGGQADEQSGDQLTHALHKD